MTERKLYRVLIELEIEGTGIDVASSVTRALDGGYLQDAIEDEGYSGCKVESATWIRDDASERPPVESYLYLSSDEFMRDPGSAMQHALSQPIVILGADKRPQIILTRTLRPLDDDE